MRGEQDWDARLGLEFTVAPLMVLRHLLLLDRLLFFIYIGAGKRHDKHVLVGTVFILFENFVHVGVV